MSNLKHILLIAGAVVIIGPVWYTVTHLNDRAVFTVLLPGVVVGVALVVVATVLRHKKRGGSLDVL